MRKNPEILFVLMASGIAIPGCSEKDLLPVKSELTIIAGDLIFAEGPAYKEGYLYFSDIDACKIYQWNQEEGLKVFRENTGRSNGICPDKNGNLIICEGENKRVVSLGPGPVLNVVSEAYCNSPLNEPNDVWVSPAGNIYFTDPVFTGTLTQDGEHVYCVKTSTGELIRVADDLSRPNGITGTVDGSLLYVADYGSARIYRYNILPDGTLAGKHLFAAIRADGLDSDSKGNIYAASDGIKMLNSSGELINTIQVPGTTTNSCIVEDGTMTIYITTHNMVFKYTINEFKH